MRCPNCEKFVSLEMADPEVENIEISDSGEITASVRIVRACADCGEEMKEATLELSDQLPESVQHEHEGDKHELEIEEDGVEPLEEGGGRYAKSFFGATVNYTVRCSCQKEGSEPIHSGSMSDKIAASHMDEMT